jgi:hypothetical protein
MRRAFVVVRAEALTGAGLAAVGVGVAVVELAAAGLRDAAADHVADGKDGRVEPLSVTADAMKMPMRIAMYAKNSVVLNDALVSVERRVVRAGVVELMCVP